MGQIWFGNLAKAGYVPAPEAGMDANVVGVEETLDFSNGGLFIGTSGGTHREYEMQWGLSDRKYMEWLVDYRNGVYGDGLLYFVDPFATNAMPPHWATPSLTVGEWPSLVGPNTQPTEVVADTNNYGFTKGARYDLFGGVTTPRRQMVLLIPSDRTLRLGFTGSSINGGTVRVVPVFRTTGTDAPEQDLTLLPPTGAFRVNASFSGATYKAVKIYLTNTDTGIGTVNLFGGNAFYTAISESPLTTGVRTSGQGHTGLSYMGSPTVSYVQAARGKQLVKMSAKFGEIGAWL